MAGIFQLTSLGPRNNHTNTTRPEKTSQHNGKVVNSKKSVYSQDKSIPASRSRLSEYSQSRDLYLDNDGTLFVQANSGVTVNKDPSMSSMVRLSQSKTQDSSIVARNEQRIDNNDRIPNRRGRKPERRDDTSMLRDEKVQHRSTSRRNGARTKERTRSTTPKASRLRGERSLPKDQHNDRRSKSRKPATRSSTDNGKRSKDNHDGNNARRQRRTISRPRGKFVSNKKKWNIAVGNGRFLPQISRSLSTDSRVHKAKKDQQQASRRASFTTKTSKDERMAGQINRDDTMDNHVGDSTKDRYHPQSGYAIGNDDHSLIDGLNAVDDTYWDFIMMEKRNQKFSDMETLEEICSFDESILDAYKDGWLATYDRCLGAVCGFEVDDLEPSSDNGKQRSQVNWIKSPSCTAVDQTCALADMTDDVVMEILGPTNEIKQPISLDMDQKKDGRIRLNK